MSSLRSPRAGVVAFCASLAVAGAAGAQQKLLSIDAIYHPDKRIEFGGSPPTDLSWLDEKRYLWVKRSEGDSSTSLRAGREWLAVDAASGRSTPLFDAARMAQALAALP